MADSSTQTATIDLTDLSAEVGLRFSEVKWNQFNSLDRGTRSEVRSEIQDITKDLMKIAEADPKRAAVIWDELVPDYVPRPLELPASEMAPEITNGIELGRKRRRQPEAYLDQSDGDAEARREARMEGPSLAARDHREERASRLPDDAEPDLKAQRVRLLLQGLEKQYLKAEERYHFRDPSGELAFEAKDKKLLTHHEAPGVINSMIDLAEARGWESLKLTGTTEFRKEAWYQAKLRGFDVSGYQPNKLDKARLEEGLKELTSKETRPNVVAQEAVKEDGRGAFKKQQELRGNDPAVVLTPQQEQVIKVLEATMAKRGDSEAAIAMARQVATERFQTSRVHVGRLVETGTAPYLDKDGASESHFVVLEGPGGQRSKIWGADLPRALENATAELGMPVVVSFRGREAVTIGGKEPGQSEVVNRNKWDVVRLDRLREDVQARAIKAAGKATNPTKIEVFDRKAQPRKAPPTVKVAPARQKEKTR